MPTIKISEESNKRILKIMENRIKEIKDVLGFDIQKGITFDSIIKLLLDFYESHSKPKLPE